ncbi:MAG: glycosyltransferase family protein [Planctomycetes bacterium]|nr:glycosyltransferase family protein [Planctomycetota bacterium]
MILCVLQVRMGSTRLPKKAVKKIMGKPMLWYMYQRLKAARLVDKIVIATTTQKEDYVIIKFAKQNHYDWYDGSENDILDRTYQAAKKFTSDAVVRVTGDCPLIDPEVIDKIVEYYLKHKNKVDYVSNVIKPTYPDGLDAELFTSSLLEKLRLKLKDAFWREWVSSYVRKYHDKSRLANIENKTDLSALRWTVDYPEDFKFVSEVFKCLYNKKRIFLMRDILNLLETHPELIEINKKYSRDSAYFEALKKAGKEKQTNEKRLYAR